MSKSILRKNLSYVLVLCFGLLISAMAANASSTISTNISTGGTLTVDTTSILTGAVTMSSTLIVAGTLTATGAINTATASSTGLVKVDSLTVGSGTTVSNLLFGTCYVNLPSAVASSTVVADCTATGVTTSSKIFVTVASSTNHIIFTGASTTAVDTIQVSVYNTGVLGTINPDGAVWSWMAVR